jgi:hypothetical protein
MAEQKAALTGATWAGSKEYPMAERLAVQTVALWAQS